ncbi:hypothetical protein ACKWTF_000531 [Chironomus riparius]
MAIKNFKWIFCLTLIYIYLSNHVTVSQMVFRDSDEQDTRPVYSQRSSWVVRNPTNTGGIKTVKTVYSSRSMDPVNEPMALQYNPYQTGSQSQANAGSMSYGYQPGMMQSGSQSQANAGSMSYGFQPGMQQSGSQANAGSMSYGYQPGVQQPQFGSGSGSYASASSSSFSGAQCTTKPKISPNTKLQCGSGACKITCLDEYKFPNGESTMSLSCMNGRWIVQNFEYNEVPPCEPVCLPKCLNNGICISPGQCKCPENFMGPTCQMKKELCLKSPPLPANSKRSCTSAMCTVTCMKGYKFPDASLSMNLLCKNGAWMPERQEIQNIPDCEPTCEPSCRNGGTCLSYNVCQCPHNFRGPQCQYSMADCSPKKMDFNGPYNCSSTGDLISCKLKCPKGISFEFEPASEYTCNYAVGEFYPRQVPKCVYGDGVLVFQNEPTHTFQFGQSNGTYIKKKGATKMVTQTYEESDGEDEEEIEETIIKKTKVIKKKKKKAKVSWEEDEEMFETPGVYQLYMSGDVEMQIRTPKPSICMLWNGNKIKTFDGVTYSHELFCSHVLVQDFKDGSFNVILRSCPYDSVQPCPHALEIFLQNEQFTFENDNGEVKMFTTKKEFPIPVQISGLKVTRSGLDVRILLESIPLTITWDSKKFVQIDASASIFNRTAGICGTMDGIMSNDFMSKDGEFHKMPSTFVDSWRALSMDKSKEQCIPRLQKMETQTACETSVDEKANLICTDLLKNPRMTNCFKNFNKDVLMKNCISDYCDCKNTLRRTECSCNGISVLAKDCRFRGIMLNDSWRDHQICPLNCTNGRVYKSCGPLNEPSCGSAIETNSLDCREGCFCPDGTMLNDGICVKKEMCPCKLKGKAFPPNSKIKRDCNTCTCENGNWECSSKTCGSRCSSVGDPHYVTFDGKRYDFMGKCSYYLMKTDELTVEAENVACSGAISESMNFLPSFTTEMPSCTKSLTMKFNDNAGQKRIIKLKQGGFVLLDGFEVSTLPWDLDDGAVVIKQASSTFLVVDFHDGVQVWWDGATRAYIDAPASYRGKTKGLCGTFNSNMQDDFLTPEGDIETTVHPFANKWQTKESCDFISDKIIPHPCQMNPENKAKAEKICSKVLKDKIFEECHLFVDPEPFYEDCMYDMCACKGDASQCACPIMAAYATECARQGTILNWRYQVAECAINCPDGQVFDQCGEACSRTCYDLQKDTPCKLQCVEGCRCPPGQVLDENNECVVISMCKCTYKGLEFKPGYKEVRPGSKLLQLCTCTGGKWICIDASDSDAVNYPAAGDISKKCSAVRHEIFTTCESAEPLTCKNMHLNVSTSTALCRPGCVCKLGYVLDTILKACVLPENCSCHHGGRSYNDGDKIKEDCNTCACKGGKWACTVKECASTCSLWGDNHFTTFDGREFDFQGVCTYVLSKGKVLNADGYSVTIQNVLCGSNGVTCSKALTINLVGEEPESITLSSDTAVPGIKGLLEAKPLKKMLTYRSGVFLIVEIPHIGVMLKWDRGTRVYLRLENRWKGKVQGLCGNYNYDALDDFLNPSAGIENNPIIFGHSWKLDDSCSMPTEQVDSCTLNPQRKTWSQFKCGLLKSSEFAQCHSEVEVDSYYKRCVHDTCSCDLGGDCECLCTSLAAYAYACTARGINIRWRTPDLCPMQCNPTCSNYNPCIEACPVETCDNMMHPLKQERLCKSDNCIEGCKLRECPTGAVYKNDSYTDCVPKSICKPVCMVVDGVTYYEDDVIESDGCYTCKCSRGAEVCTGTPCIDNAQKVESLFVCETGWTEWLNQDIMQNTSMPSKASYFKDDDNEPMPRSSKFQEAGKKVQCAPDFYASIECRTVVGHNHPKMTGQNVECSMENGLVCKGQCFDYETRYFCDCGAFGPQPTLIDTTTTTSKPTTVKIPIIPIIPVIPFTTPKYEIAKVCDPSVPLVKHPVDCSKYLQCVMSHDGLFEYVEQTCGSSMMFNPTAMVCDWPASVIAINPNCGKPKEELQGDCPMGYVWNDCAVPCRRACNYYGRILMINGNCTEASNDCLPGCVPKDAITKCEYPNLWRDWKTCVKLMDCTCIGPNNEQLKPGQVVKISDCKTCQCINNEFICTEAACGTSPKPIKIISVPTYHPDAEIIITGKPSTAWPQVLSTTKKSVVIIEEEEQVPYYITICEPFPPHIEHPNSCYKFLHCMPAPNGSYVYAVKTCYPDMMYNPIAMVCDWPDSVKRLKPSCGVDPGEIEIWEVLGRKPTTTTQQPRRKVTGPDETDYFEGEPPAYIRECNPANPLAVHPNSCIKYLLCAESSPHNFKYTEKKCNNYPNIMFNPNTLKCDTADNVKLANPKCATDIGETDYWEEIVEKVTRRSTTTTRSSGFVSTSRPAVDGTISFAASTIRPVTIRPTEPGRTAPYITICEPSPPHIEHPNSCYKFLHCMPAPNGSYMYAVKTCYPNMMYNPVAMVCDWPDNVKRLKPSCGINPGETDLWELDIKTTTPSTKRKFTLPEHTDTDYWEAEVTTKKRTTPRDIPVHEIEITQTRPSTLPPHSQITGTPMKIIDTTPSAYIPGQVTPPAQKPTPIIFVPPIYAPPGQITPIAESTTQPSGMFGPPLPPFDRKVPPLPPIKTTVAPVDVPYYITICEPFPPHIEHPNSCYKFLHCMPAPNGSYVYAVKTCYPDMMYNPVAMVCDWPDSVKRIKPICGINPGETEVWEVFQPTIAPITRPGAVDSTVSTTSTLSPEMVEVPIYLGPCDLEKKPFDEHPDGCHKFLQCVLTPNDTYVYEERTCGINKMFNPKTLDCDDIANVQAIKPICRTSPGEPGEFGQTGKRIVRPGVITTRRPDKIKPTRKPTTTTIPSVVTESTLTPLILLPSTVTPPIVCEKSKLVPLLHLLPDTAFTSSSVLGRAFKPESARLESRPSDGSVGSWSPATNDLNQYLQIDFPSAMPIYGVMVRGSPLLTQYVTSFKVLYSLDGIVYHIIPDASGNPLIFSGSIDQNTPVQHIFRTPVEAKLIRFYPLTWHEGIAIRVEILGCQRDPRQPLTLPPAPTTTTKSIETVTQPTKIIEEVFAPITTPASVFTITTIQPLCDDPLGVENSKLSPNQITFSSIKDAGSVKTKVRRNPLEIIKLSSARGWMPLADNVNEYVMFDFMENRNLTGVITKGGEYGWVKSFTIQYSKDNIIWNKLFDKNGRPAQFLANVDSDNVKKNHFPSPINARYLKIQPLKWHQAIELKLEPIGCYLPYPTPDPTLTTTTSKYPEDVEIITPESICGICKGALVPLSANNRDTCLCYPPQYWNGIECVPQSDCPCFEGHMSYPVGEAYRTEDCAECMCQMGGIPQCTPKTCSLCPKGQKRVAPGTCDCKCERCPPDTVICQSSGECIPESKWCDGQIDCPDDELNCLITEQPSITVNRTETITITKKCPDPSCPPGFAIKPKKSRKSKMSSRFSDDEEEDDKPQHQYYYIKAKYTASYEAILPISTSKDQQDINSEECFEFMCIPIVDSAEIPDYAQENQTKIIRCPEPKCPRGYMLRLQIQKSANECAKFTCEPIAENDAVCNVTGRTFNTFDSTEFKYDICSHLLARDVSDEKWNVIMRKNCSSGNNVCSKEIEIRDKVAKYTLILYPSLTVNLDGYYYTVQQLQNSNRKMSFVVSKNGDNLLYVSHTHGFWITMDQYGDVKLGISSQYVNQVDGLCGFYSNEKTDDKRMPNGKLATSTVEFGDSWSVSQTNKEDCEPQVCPKMLQEAAWTMCNLVKDDIFLPCTKSINPTHFISTCLETACDCLQALTNGTAPASISASDFESFKKECKCSMLKNYVVECMAADENVHLETWRSVHSCEAVCAAPLVHQDCYRRKCEVTCNNLQSADCANIPGTCFSGCFCPSGTVKKGSTCIPISECRDCVCDGFGKSQYLTYDRKNFTFDGNCTYLLSRDVTLQNVHTFEVYATIGPCDTKANTIAKKKVTCTQALHITYGSHIIHIQKNSMKNLEVIVDGIKLSGLSYTQDWIKITEQGKALNILLPESQVELVTMFEAMSFSIKVPSVKYGNKMEGICGNCNGNPEDDLTTNPAVPNLPLTNTPIQNFALSWLADEPKLKLTEDKDKCYVDEASECLPLPPETDPCFKILDEDIFGKCHMVVDPIMYITACQQDLCRTGPTQKGSCESLAAYARECARNGICVDWRRNGLCTMECVAPYVYTACGCPETCQTVQARENLIKSSPALNDPKTIEKMRSICNAGMSEGCFCPKGLVLHNGKCLREIECRACDDKGHLPGDIWHLDVCTKCTCQNDSTIQCQKTQCPAQQTICGIGFTALESSQSSGECCKKYACVPEVKTLVPTTCSQLVLPKCGVDQTNKIINDTNGCSKYICDCIPKSQCKPTQNYNTTKLEPGFKAIIDTTGCCPVSKLICDKSLCPPRPIQCTEAFYVVEKTKSADDKICCDIYECRPPPDRCVATINGNKILKKMDEIWPTDDACVKAQCAFDTNGNPIIKTQREICNTICQAGSELKPIPGKCCGECVKTKCIVENKLYDIGQTWSSDDNCTTFECNIKDGETMISSMMPTCPDISSCPILMRYKDGCCEKCKMESLSQKNCMPESLAESTTIGLIQIQMPPHGNCKNVNGVRGITECVGSCKSGTKFDPMTLHQLKTCECCSVSGVRELPVELVCDDNYKFIKNFNVPASCSCSKCGIEEQLNKLRAAF